RTVVDEVVDVTADGARGQKGGGNLRVTQARRRSGQQPQLHLARHREIAFQPLLLVGDTLVEPRVRNGNRYLRRQRRKRGLVLLVVVVDARMLQVHHADDAALVD